MKFHYLKWNFFKLFENSIFLAIRWSDAEILELLLDKNGDPNTYNKLAASPLHLCVDFRDYDCARTLLKHNANPNYQNNDGKTPFHNAVEQREYKLSSIFAENGANSEIRDAQLRTVWMLADDSFKRKVLHDEKGKMNEEIRKEINENENGSEGMKDICFLCKTRKANRVLLPCGHRVLCSYCSRKFLEQYNICPKCHMAVFGSSLR